MTQNLLYLPRRSLVFISFYITFFFENARNTRGVFLSFHSFFSFSFSFAPFPPGAFSVLAASLDSAVSGYGLVYIMLTP